MNTILTKTTILVFVIIAVSAIQFPVSVQASTTETPFKIAQITTGNSNALSNTVVTGNSNSGTQSTGAQTITNPLQFSSLQDLLNAILGAMITIGTIALTAAIIWIGFTFVTARGDPKKLQTARMALLWTVIGGLILLGAKGIETVIQSTVSSVTS